MTRFYSVSDRTSYARGAPVIKKIKSGMVEGGICRVCGGARRWPHGDLLVQLGRSRAEFWPDVIACGDYPCLVLSQRFVDALEQSGAGFRLGGRVEFSNVEDTGLSIASPQYYWVDGARSCAGAMDFDASGFVDVQFCPSCGRRTDNIGATYDRRHAQPAPGDVFKFDEHSGLDIFTTDLSPTAFFCTERVVSCAKINKVTNAAFRRVEDGRYGKPLDLARWRPGSA